MTLPRVKLFEREMALSFFRKMGLDAEIVDDNLESPDLAVVLGGKLIGVEITQIQKNVAERIARSYKDAVVQRAREAYVARGGSPLSVTFSFHMGADVGKVDRRKLSGQIASFLIAHAPAYGQLLLAAGNELPEELRSSFRELRCWGTEMPSIWRIAEAGWVAQLTPGVLQAAVNAKEAKLDRYREKGFGEYWLLICAHPTNPACRFDPAADFDGRLVSSPFDRTYFYDCWHLLEIGGSKGPPVS